MVSYVRGNVIRWTTTPYDVDGVVTTPAGVELEISYPYKHAILPNRPLTHRVVEVVMTQSGDEWTAEWDSSVAITGHVNWTIRVSGPSSADRGGFELT